MNPHSQAFSYITWSYLLLVITEPRNRWLEMTYVCKNNNNNNNLRFNFRNNIGGIVLSSTSWSSSFYTSTPFWRQMLHFTSIFLFSELKLHCSFKLWICLQLDKTKVILIIWEMMNIKITLSLSLYLLKASIWCVINRLLMASILLCVCIPSVLTC